MTRKEVLKQVNKYLAALEIVIERRTVKPTTPEEIKGACAVLVARFVDGLQTESGKG